MVTSLKLNSPQLSDTVHLGSVEEKEARESAAAQAGWYWLTSMRHREVEFDLLAPKGRVKGPTTIVSGGT